MPASEAATSGAAARLAATLDALRSFGSASCLGAPSQAMLTERNASRYPVDHAFSGSCSTVGAPYYRPGRDPIGRRLRSDPAL